MRGVRNSEKLAAYRVDRGKGGFWAIPMTEDEITNRNFFIRLILRDNPAWKLSDKQLEQVRVFRIGSVLVIEDEDLYTFILAEEKRRK